MATNNPLLDLIALEGHFPKLISESREFLGQLSRSQKVGARPTLRIGDLEHALTAYLEGLISREQLEEWASMLEMNDHIDYEPGKETEVAEALFQLATPELHEQVSPAFAKDMRARLIKVRLA